MVSDFIQSKLANLQQMRGRQSQLQEQLSETEKSLRELSRDQRLTEQAQIIIQNVAQLTQQTLQYKISEIVTLALASVFDDPYAFEIEFVVKRGKTECDLWFTRRGERVHPLTASGGGAVDVACLALRIALWRLSQPKTRNVLILDEPFIHLKGTDANRAALRLAKMLSEDLGVQIIMVNDERVPLEDIVETADKVFQTKIRNGVTTIK